MQSAHKTLNVAQDDNESQHRPPGDAVQDDSHLDLNDHRQQKSSLPRTADLSPRPRRGTFTSMYDGNDRQPDVLRVDHAAINEQAVITDNEAPERVSHDGDFRHSRRGRGSASPVVPRRSTVRRQRPQLLRDDASSRGSSPSPATSVHAFAEGRRRRRRATTIESKAASSVDLPLKRPASTGSHSRRATFTDKDDESGHSSAEEDVCFPRAESRNSDNHSIAYSELEDLVEEQEAERVARDHEAQASPMPARPHSPKIPKLKLDRSHLKPDHSSDEDFDELEKHKTVRPDSLAANPYVSKPDVAKRWWTFFSSEMDDVIHSQTIGGLLDDGETFQDLFRVPEDEGCWWLDALNATEDEIVALCKAFSVHGLTREDIVTQDAREKIELFKAYYFVSFKSFMQLDKTDADYLEPVSHYALVFRHGVITFTNCQGPHTKNVIKRIGRLRDYMSLNADWICYALLDDIVDSFMTPINDMEKEVDCIEDGIFSARDEDARPILQRIAECRKRCISLLRLLGTKPDVIKGFAKRCNENFASAPSTNVGLYLSDIQDHILTHRDNLTHSEQLLSRLHNNFLAQLNVEHISSGNKVNKLLGKVTLVATILVPLNLVTGLFGMNVPVPGRDSENLAWFFGILGFIFLMIASALGVAKRFKFI